MKIIELCHRITAWRPGSGTRAILSKLEDIQLTHGHILATLYTLVEKDKASMVALADINTHLDTLEGAEAKTQALLGAISAELKAALANGADPVVIQAIIDRIDADTAKNAAAVAANPDPAAPPAA